MKKFEVLCANLGYLVACILWVYGRYLAAGIVFYIAGIWALRYRWNETHDTLYTVGIGIFYVFIVLYLTWLAPQEILPIGWLFLALVGFIALQIYKGAKD